MRDHLERLLHHRRLKAVQWINLNRHVVEFATLSKRATDRIMAGQNHKSDAIREQALGRGIRSSAGLM
jgi:hypothetical protein